MCLAIPGKITAIEPSEDPMFRIGKVSFDGVLREVNLAMVPEASVDDYVLVHVGIALQVIDEEEAEKTLACFRELDELNDIGPDPKEDRGES